MTSSEMVYYTSDGSSEYICSMETVIQERIIVHTETTRGGLLLNQHNKINLRL